MKSFLTHQPMLKALSLLLAFGLWVFIHGEQQIERNVDVKVEPVNVPKGYVVTGEWEEHIHLRIVGPRTRLAKIDDGYFKPFALDFKGKTNKDLTFPIFEEQFSVPRGTRVTRISPSMIRLHLDRQEERLVRVEPKLIGDLEEGYSLQGTEVVPRFARVRGPRMELSRMGMIATEPIPLSGQRNSFRVTAEVSKLGVDWEIDPATVTVSIDVAEGEISKTVREVPVVVSGLKPDWVVKPDRVTLRIRGSAGKVTTLLQENLEVTVDARKLLLRSTGKKPITVAPKLPKRAGIEITMVPDNVRLSHARED